MYINTATQAYPLSQNDIRIAHPNVSFAEPFTPPVNYAVVFPSPKPAYDPVTQYVREIAPAIAGDHYEQRWEVASRYGSQVDTDAAVAANLESMKAAKRAEINAARLAANFTVFTHAGKVIACDQLSRSDIDGANGFITLYGALPPGWPGGWKAADNSIIPIATVDDWKAFYTSMFAQGNANFAKSQALKAALVDATTAAQVAAVSWSA